MVNTAFSQQGKRLGVVTATANTIAVQHCAADITGQLDVGEVRGGGRGVLEERLEGGELCRVAVVKACGTAGGKQHVNSPGLVRREADAI